MYVYNIEQDKQPKNDIGLSGPSLFPASILAPVLNLVQQSSNNSNQDDKNDKYKHPRYYDIGRHKNLTTLNSHQGEWYLTDLKNSDELRDLNTRISNLSDQIDNLQNKLSKTKFKCSAPKATITILVVIAPSIPNPFIIPAITKITGKAGFTKSKIPIVKTDIAINTLPILSKISPARYLLNIRLTEASAINKNGIAITNPKGNATDHVKLANIVCKTILVAKNGAKHIKPPDKVSIKYGINLHKLTKKLLNFSIN